MTVVRLCRLDSKVRIYYRYGKRVITSNEEKKGKCWRVIFEEGCETDSRKVKSNQYLVRSKNKPVFIFNRYYVPPESGLTGRRKIIICDNTGLGYFDTLGFQANRFYPNIDRSYRPVTYSIPVVQESRIKEEFNNLKLDPKVAIFNYCYSQLKVFEDCVDIEKVPGREYLQIRYDREGMQIQTVRTPITTNHIDVPKFGELALPLELTSVIRDIKRIDSMGGVPLEFKVICDPDKYDCPTGTCKCGDCCHDEITGQAIKKVNDSLLNEFNSYIVGDI